MSTSHREPPPAPPAESAGCLSVIARVLWLALGNIALLFLLVPIALGRRFSYLDVIFWGILVALLAIRFADIRFLRGQDADGAPATMADWRRYAVLVVAIAGGAWTVVHIILLLLH